MGLRALVFVLVGGFVAGISVVMTPEGDSSHLVGPADGAATPVYLPASPDAADVTGEYFADCEPAEPAAVAREEAFAREFWESSADLAGTAE